MREENACKHLVLYAAVFEGNHAEHRTISSEGCAARVGVDRKVGSGGCGRDWGTGSAGRGNEGVVLLDGQDHPHSQRHSNHNN